MEMRHLWFEQDVDSPITFLPNNWRIFCRVCTEHFNIDIKACKRQIKPDILHQIRCKVQSGYCLLLFCNVYVGIWLTLVQLSSLAPSPHFITFWARDGGAGRQEQGRRQKMVGGTKNYFYIYIWGHGGAHKCVNLKDRRIDQKPITGRVSRAFCPTQVFPLFPYAA